MTAPAVGRTVAFVREDDQQGGGSVDNQDLMTRLSVERCCIEQDLALGRRRRARRRAAAALESLMAALRKPDPELSSWLRVLAALAVVDRPAPAPPQLSLWPELAPDAPGTGAPGRAAPAGPGSLRAPAAMGLGVITQDERMLEALRFLEQLAPTELPVLIEGESGTGKEVVARAVHAMSRRGRGPWVAVNCGAMPAQLQESELFGHVRGAFTGAALDKPGLFEAADGGTLFLDEVGEMDPRAQVKLLRVLETGELRRLGEVRLRTVDVRIVAATNADVGEAVRAGRFRKDLLFRLGAVRTWLPPLRLRRGDILPLAHYFIRRASPQSPAMTPGARSALITHDWPGNVRELKFVIQRSLALRENSGAAEITVEMLFPVAVQQTEAGRGARIAGGREPGPRPAQIEHVGEPLLPAGRRLDDYLGEIERGLILQALRQAGGNRTHAARLLGGLSRTTLIGKLKRLGLDGLLPCAAAGGGGAA
jgi:transcriptional regulator with PAS, ATPase and Fis domain